jgi:hypothetical protein
MCRCAVGANLKMCGRSQLCSISGPRNLRANAHACFSLSLSPSLSLSLPLSLSLSCFLERQWVGGESLLVCIHELSEPWMHSQLDCFSWKLQVQYISIMHEIPHFSRQKSAIQNALRQKSIIYLYIVHELHLKIQKRAVTSWIFIAGFWATLIPMIPQAPSNKICHIKLL